MIDFKIPEPQSQPSDEPSQITLIELSKMTPDERLTVQNERMVDMLQRQLEREYKEKDYYREKCSRLDNAATEVKALKRAKIEMFISFFLGTFLMVGGGTLIGSFPIDQNGNMSWEYIAGWVVMILGFIMSVSNRLAVWFVCYLFPGILKDESTAK